MLAALLEVAFCNHSKLRRAFLHRFRPLVGVDSGIANYCRVLFIVVRSPYFRLCASGGAFVLHSVMLFWQPVHFQVLNIEILDDINCSIKHCFALLNWTLPVGALLRHLTQCRLLNILRPYVIGVVKFHTVHNFSSKVYA